jgi:hypothetical protein
MSALAQALHRAPHELLPGPYAEKPGDAVVASPAVARLAHSQVQALLDSSAAFAGLPPARQEEIAADLEKIATYLAALTHEDWHRSLELGQTPVVRNRTVVEAVPQRTSRTRSRAPVRSQAEGTPADEFSPRAASQVARITEDTLNAIAFPTFVADLVKGTFQAIVDASIQQMEAYGQLIANVAKTVDEFMADNITDNNARDWLSGAYPDAMKLETREGAPQLVANPDADPARYNFRRDLNLERDVALDDDTIEQTLVPAARRRLAQSRQQMLATMVLMGINRIVVTSGKIKASMGFRIDTTDTGRAESASQFDFKHENEVKYGWFLSPAKVSAKTTVAYVSSSKKSSEDSIDVHADLTGEVELRFKSETFPLERFADTGVIGTIQSNTPVPGANKPVTGNTAANAAAD